MSAMKSATCAWALCALGLLAAAPAAAQRHEVTLEASVIRGAVGYARQVAPRVLVGGEAGFGFPQIDRTLSPEVDDSGNPDFEEYLHLAGFVRLVLSGSVELDAGLRGSVASLWDCTASDCWPALFGGGYLQPMVGWRRIKVGVRLSAGWIAETREGTPAGSTSLIGFTPFLLRATFPL